MTSLERLKELAVLQPGWYDGDGEIPSPQDFQRAEDIVSILPSHLQPLITPMVAGGLCLEWPALARYPSLDISEKENELYWHELYGDDDDFVGEIVNFEEVIIRVENLVNYKEK